MATKGRTRATDRKLRSLQPRKERFDVWFEGGLGVRVGPGKKTWQTMVRVDGKQRRIALGQYPAVGVAKANSLCADANERAHKGEDPAAVVPNYVPRGSKVAEVLTVGELIDEYLEKHARVKKRSAGQDEGFLEREIRPLWGSRPAAEITRRDVMGVLDEIVARGSPVSANRTLAVTRKMFNWGVRREMVGASPCVEIERPALEIERDRTLSEAEIKSFCSGLGEVTDFLKRRPARQVVMDGQIAHMLTLLLVTGVRRSELVGAAWGEFNLAKGTWEIPAARTKSGRAHVVYLSPLAMTMFTAARYFRAPGEHVFINPKTRKPYSPYSVSQAMRKTLDVLGLADNPATPHDLRRTFATQLAELGFSRTVIGRCLNHAEIGVTARAYDKYSYARERQQAMDAWAARLKEIVSGMPAPSNVVEIAAAG